MIATRSVHSINIEVEHAWSTGTFHRRVNVDPDYVRRYDDLPQVPYESFMRARVVRGIRGQVGVLLVEFDPMCTEDNRLHTHPLSDRILTVLKGSGLFIARRDNVLGVIRLTVGDQIFMPKGVIHTFASGDAGMIIRSVQSPFQSLDDPQIFGESDVTVDVAALASGRISLPDLSCCAPVL